MKNNLYVKSPSVYTTQLVTIAGNSSMPINITTNQIPFELRMITGYSSSPTDALVHLKLDNQTGDITKNPVGFSEICGTAQLPFLLPVDARGQGAVLPNSTNIQITMYNNNAAPQTMRINMIGYDINDVDEYQAEITAMRKTAVLNAEAFAKLVATMIAGVKK